jgi:hypothetical protein
MQEPGAQEPAGKAARQSPSGHAPGPAVTVIITGTEDAHYLDGPGVPMTAVRLDPKAFAYVPANVPGVIVATGDVLPVILESLQGSVGFWEPADEIPDCPACGEAEGLCGNHAEDRRLADLFRGVLKQLGGAE